jgi:hypothetical protein
MLNHSRRIFVSAAIAAAAIFVLTCKSNGPTDWNKFDEQTVEQNLATLKSAGDVYAAKLASGGVDSAAFGAQAALLASAGVDTAGIAPDSTVWALFDNGLLAGTGEVLWGGSALAPRRSPAEGKVRASANWEVTPLLTVVTPNAFTDPVSDTMGLWAGVVLHDVMRWQPPHTYTDAEVTVDAAKSVFASGPGLIYWIGHGVTVQVPGGGSVNGLMLGTTYDTRAMAQAAAATFLADLTPTGRDKRCALWWDKGAQKYIVVLLPAFVRQYAKFDTTGWPANAPAKTMVCLSACFSAYGNPGDMVQAFLDKGADVVWGYDWAVEQDWCADRDSAFFCAMADTCLPFEAWNRTANVCPTPWRGGNASLRVYGDSLVRVQNVTRVKKEGRLYRAATSYGERAAGLTAVVTALRLQPDSVYSEDAITDALEVMYPGESPGQFNTATDPVAEVAWTDMLTGRVYFASQGRVGVGCQINVAKSTADFIGGTFSGTVGYWEATQNPESVPPMQTLHLNGGCFKVTVLETTGSR